MKVKELIEQLRKLDGNLYVYVNGYEGGVWDCDDVGDPIEVALNVNSEGYYGPHEVIYKCDKMQYEGREKNTGIVLE